MDPPSLQFLFDEGVAVQPVGGVKRKETCHAHNDRAQNLIPDIEIVMRKAAALVRQDAVVGSFVGNFGMLIRKVRPCSMLLKMKYTPYAFCFSRRRSAGRTQTFFFKNFSSPFLPFFL